MFFFGSSLLFGDFEKKRPSVTSTTNFPWKFASFARSSRIGLGELPSMASCTASSPVSERHVGMSRSYFMREEPMKTVASFEGWYTFPRWYDHSGPPSSYETGYPL